MVTAGLFGKLPAHGDFVTRGWSLDVVTRLDGWLTDGIAALRANVGEDGFAHAMQSGPLWHCWLSLGAAALHGVITPTVDSAGRLFLLVAGVTGGRSDIWAIASQQPAFAGAAEAAVYDALGAALDADGLALRLAEAIPPVDGVGRFLADLSLPAASAFWVANPAAGPPVALPGEALDAGTVARLVMGAFRDAP
ncbi:type VI secretion system-associated protein TagF [Sandarakinorhabdus sp.]|uniref:type VI secretion system-associated protein TagF n=1 Tax=Sandarakinorhabdus sp. TaxID=1916663 RepID=UPI00286DE94B|nr:type VI secretion system-associated protein TagF [Sandarakinorhabdus sp.]